MAAKISVPVPWPHILESARLPKSLSFNSFFFFWQLPCFGGLLTQNIFFSKLGKLILNFLEHSHTWDDVEREKLSGGLWSERVLKTILKSRKVPVYPTSRREKKNWMIICGTKLFGRRADSNIVRSGDSDWNFGRHLVGWCAIFCGMSFLEGKNIGIIGYFGTYREM